MGKTLILGGTGLLGPYLAAAGRLRRHEVIVTGKNHGMKQGDITRTDLLASIVEDIKPDHVINCVALTDVDRCESETSLAELLNAGIARDLVKLLPEETQMIHISTDQVYSGDNAPHIEKDIGPINIYGRTKLEGEIAAMEHPNTLVLRTNFFGQSKTAGRMSLSDWVIKSLKNTQPITLFSDAFFTPLNTATLANLIFKAIDKRLKGIFNLGSRDGMSKADFGMMIADIYGLSTDHVTIGRMSEKSSAAPRPADLRMNVTKIEESLGQLMPTLESQIIDLKKIR
jgi:dTDP-4-dehydrorhamnose reductase